MDNKRMIILLVLSVFIVIAATVGVTYAYISVSSAQTNSNTMSTTCYDMEFTESNRINIIGYPMSSSSAFSKLTPYTFTLTNNCEANTEYQIILNVINTTSSTILPYINYSFDGSTVNKLSSLTAVALPAGVTSSDATASYIINTGSLTGKSAAKSFSLYMWIDESAGNDIMGNTFEGEIIVYNVAS